MRPRTLTLWLIPAIGLLLAGLSGAQDDDAAKVPDKIPAEAKKIKNPVPADEASLEHGRLLFTSQCTMCHGNKGDGKGDLVGRLGYDMPDFTDAAMQKGHTDGEMFYVLSNGHGKMSGQSDRLDDKARWDLVNFIRALAE